MTVPFGELVEGLGRGAVRVLRIAAPSRVEGLHEFPLGQPVRALAL